MHACIRTCVRSELLTHTRVSALVLDETRGDERRGEGHEKPVRDERRGEERDMRNRFERRGEERRGT